jgi:hypothetical protein
MLSDGQMAPVNPDEYRSQNHVHVFDHRNNTGVFPQVRALVHPTGQYSKKCPQVEGHVLHLSGRHAKLRREGYRKRQHR